MEAKVRGIVSVTLAIIFVVALTIGSTLAYMTDGESLTQDIRVGTAPETTAEPETATGPPGVYTVTYDANGGADAPPDDAKTQGEALELSWQVPVHGAGYIFAGWAADSAAPAAQYQPGGSYTADESAALYAVWIP